MTITEERAINTTQQWPHALFYLFFGLCSAGLMLYYLSNTVIHFTTPQQFPINSFQRFPLTILIFPIELFSFAFGTYFVYLLISSSLKKQQQPKPLPKWKRGKVALLLPVYNEPTHIVQRTLDACRAVEWEEGVATYLLDDSTDENHKRAMEALAKRYGAKLVRRQDRAGYKAGNINNAIATAVTEPYFAIFDSDQAPLKNFLRETMDYFSDPSVGFVQTPQYYINDQTPLERAAKIGTNVFFQAQCVGKASDGAMPFCGTNAVVKTEAFKGVQGFAYYTATEDIDLGIRMNQSGYFGAYVPKILVKGYAPPDFVAYSSQQYRWANGNLAILREHWLKILLGDFTLRYQINTLFTLGWWLTGIVTLGYVIVPILSVILGLGTHHAWLPTALIVLLYVNVLMGISMVYVALHGRTAEKVRITDALLQYSLITNSMFIYAKAAINALFKRYVGFVRTNKTGSASGWQHIKPNLALGTLCFLASIYGLFRWAQAYDFQQVRTYLPVSVWLLFYSVVLLSSILFVGGAAPMKNAKPLPRTRALQATPEASHA